MAMSDNNVGPTEVLHRLRALSERLEAGLEIANDEKPSVRFADLLHESLNRVNTTQQRASAMGQAYELGDPNVSTAELVIAMQKSSLAFQGALQVRNKLVAAYQDIMSMPV